MSYAKDQLDPYVVLDGDLIPIHTWNKKIAGVERGKTPLHSDWTTKEYSKTDVKKWIKQGFNLGYRIREDELIIDLDPRNYGLGDEPDLLAELMGFFDFSEVIETLPTVKTGGGGYHIYCTLPFDVDHKDLKETVEDLQGIEFKRKGRQVLCAGSKHPSGKYYKWINTNQRQDVPDKLLNLITRTNKIKSDYKSGAGSLTGRQLDEMILSKLDPKEYNDNNQWFPLLAASHHATNGEGVEEFVAWSISDPDYQNDEHVIRLRWDSLAERENSITIGTLLHELDQAGEDSADVKAILTFANQPEIDIDEDDSEEFDIIKDSKKIADEIDVSDVYSESESKDGVEGKAIAMANKLKPNSSPEDIMKCIRLIKAADSLEAIRTQEVLVANNVLKQASINKLLKETEVKVADDLALMLSKKTLEVTFNNGKHLTCPPNGQLWAFHKTHWRPISDEFLGKLIHGVLQILRKKMDIEAPELVLVQQAIRLIRYQVSTLNDRIHSTELPPSVINCKNGELWINKDGSHSLKPHNYKSYLINCLNVDYNPAAKCPLFMQTLEEIFHNFLDTDDLINHMAEILGYTLQPYKNIASWWLFRGPGGDGKSTILKILGGILQDAQLMTGVKLLSAGSTDGYNHALNSVVGKLAVIIEEIPSNYLIKDAGVKLFSESTKMEANPKTKEAYNFMYAGNLIMCANGYPAIKDLSHGMLRRANVIPFNQQFTRYGREDIDRAARILNNKEEMSGVLNFMLEGLQRLRDRGQFNPPDSCVEAKAQWFGEANNVVRFLNDTIVITNNIKDSLGTLKSFYGIHYDNWCDDNEISDRLRKGRQHFIQDLRNLGLVVQKAGGNNYKVYGGYLLS